MMIEILIFLIPVLEFQNNHISISFDLNVNTGNNLLNLVFHFMINIIHINNKFQFMCSETCCLEHFRTTHISILFSAYHISVLSYIVSLNLHVHVYLPV